MKCAKTRAGFYEFLTTIATYIIHASKRKPIIVIWDVFRTVLDEARQNRTERIKKIKIPVECLRFNFQTKTYVCDFMCYWYVHVIISLCLIEIKPKERNQWQGYVTDYEFHALSFSLLKTVTENTSCGKN